MDLKASHRFVFSRVPRGPHLRSIQILTDPTTNNPFVSSSKQNNLSCKRCRYVRNADNKHRLGDDMQCVMSFNCAKTKGKGGTTCCVKETQRVKEMK